jgi:hypothetical protein
MLDYVPDIDKAPRPVINSNPHLDFYCNFLKPGTVQGEIIQQLQRFIESCTRQNRHMAL